jgi:hypothetical protein
MKHGTRISVTLDPKEPMVSAVYLNPVGTSHHLVRIFEGRRSIVDTGLREVQMDQIEEVPWHKVTS